MNLVIDDCRVSRLGWLLGVNHGAGAAAVVTAGSNTPRAGILRCGIAKVTPRLVTL